MIEFSFSTTDTTIAAGRATVLNALALQFAGVGFGPYVPANPATLDHIAMRVPGSVIASQLPAQYQAAAAADVIVIDTNDGLTSYIDPADGITPVVSGYFFDMLVALRFNDDKLPALLSFFRGWFISRWTSQANTTQAPTATQLALDPGRPTLVWKLRNSARYWNGSIRVRKHHFLGAP